MHPEVAHHRVGVAHKEVVKSVLELGEHPGIEGLVASEPGHARDDVLQAESFAALAKEVVALRAEVDELKKSSKKSTSKKEKS